MNSCQIITDVMTMFICMFVLHFPNVNVFNDCSPLKLTTDHDFMIHRFLLRAIIKLELFIFKQSNRLTLKMCTAWHTTQCEIYDPQDPSLQKIADFFIMKADFCSNDWAFVRQLIFE